MFKVTIPGRGDLEIQHAVFDFNGTLATDGRLADGTRKLLGRLKDIVDVHVITSDTYGTAREECRDVGISVKTLTGGLAATEKAAIVANLGAQHTCCIGNGVNDAEMFQVCGLAIVVIGDEGAAVKALKQADIVVKNIEDGITLLLQPSRITATLRG